MQREDCIAHKPLYVRALRIIGELKRTDLQALLNIGKQSDDDDIIFWSHWSAVLLGDKSAINRLIPFITADETYWARYRKLYKWAPAYKDGKNSTDKEMVAKFLNGEWHMMPTILTEEVINTPRPLPRHLEFSVDVGDESLYYIITFEEFELMEAFEKLGAQSQDSL